MLRWRVRTLAQPRSKKGAPHQSTTGVARTSSTQSSHDAETTAKAPGAKCRPIATTASGTVSAPATRRRRRKSRYSSEGPSVSAIPLGSSAMPQIGQVPGPTCSTSGCIGQVWVSSGAAWGAVRSAGSRNASGRASNLALHPAEQKWTGSPSWRATWRAVSTLTLMPQTGSVAVASRGSGPVPGAASGIG